MSESITIVGALSLSNTAMSLSYTGNAGKEDSMDLDYTVSADLIAKDEGKRIEPKDAGDAANIARAFSALSHGIDTIRYDDFADHRVAMKAYKAKVSEFLTNPTQADHPGDEPVKPPLSEEAKTAIAPLEEQVKQLRETFSRCRFHTFKIGKFSARLLDIFQKRPSAYSLATTL